MPNTSALLLIEFMFRPICCHTLSCVKDMVNIVEAPFKKLLNLMSGSPWARKGLYGLYDDHGCRFLRGSLLIGGGGVMNR